VQEPDRRSYLAVIYVRVLDYLRQLLSVAEGCGQMAPNERHAREAYLCYLQAEATACAQWVTLREQMGSVIPAGLDSCLPDYLWSKFRCSAFGDLEKWKTRFGSGTWAPSHALSQFVKSWVAVEVFLDSGCSPAAITASTLAGFTEGVSGTSWMVRGEGRRRFERLTLSWDVYDCVLAYVRIFRPRISAECPCLPSGIDSCSCPLFPRNGCQPFSRLSEMAVHVFKYLRSVATLRDLSDALLVEMRDRQELERQLVRDLLAPPV
jgi:hypothetical protein